MSCCASDFYFDRFLILKLKLFVCFNFVSFSKQGSKAWKSQNSGILRRMKSPCFFFFCNSEKQILFGGKSFLCVSFFNVFVNKGWSGFFLFYFCSIVEINSIFVVENLFINPKKWWFLGCFVSFLCFLSVNCWKNKNKFYVSFSFSSKVKKKSQSEKLT
jgi:hypothetical protein